MKTNIFRGDITDISAKKEALVALVWELSVCRGIWGCAQAVGGPIDYLNEISSLFKQHLW